MSSEATSLANDEANVCQKLIQTMVEGHAEISGALVSTVDGFEVAAFLGGQQSAAKLSAMTSSMLALSEAICIESGIGRSVDMMVEANAGRLLLMDIPVASNQLLLTAICDRDTTLGQVLWAVRRCREQIALSLGGA
jgi:uncharacterized protein